LVNRQGFDDKRIDGNDYNRIVGGDFNLVTKSKKLRGKLFYPHALTPEKQNDNFARASWLMLSTRHVFAMWNHEYVGENYDAEVGFVPRNKQYNPITDSVETPAYWRIEPLFFYNFTPASGPVVIHGPGINADFLRTKITTSRTSNCAQRTKLVFGTQLRSKWDTATHSRVCFSTLM
jgi:hypothetical protein